jgi:hypothetical protein
VLTQIVNRISGWWRRRQKIESVDTIEDIAVLGALLVFGSLSLAVIVLMY